MSLQGDFGLRVWNKLTAHETSLRSASLLVGPNKDSGALRKSLIATRPLPSHFSLSRAVAVLKP